MKTLLNTIKYGSASIKRLLVLIALFIVAGIGCIVAAIITGHFVFLFGTAVAVFAGISAAQSILIAGGDLPETPPISESTASVSESEELQTTSTETNAENNLDFTKAMDDLVYVNTLDDETPVAQNVVTTVNDTVANKNEVVSNNVVANKNIVNVPNENVEDLSDTETQHSESYSKTKKSKKKDKKKKSFFGLFSKTKKTKKVETDDETGVIRSLKTKRKEKPKIIEDDNSNEITKDDIHIFEEFETSRQTSSVAVATDEEADYSAPNVLEFLDEFAPQQEKSSKNKVKETKNQEVSDENEDEQLTENHIQSKQASEEVIVSYSRKKIRQTMKKYKVKRDHRLILVDRSDKYGIFQSPAFIWANKGEFHMLLIEKEPRELVFPLYGVSKIDYLPKQTANSDVDYPAFHKDCMITRMFKDYLPDYQHSTVVGDMTAMKNLYGFGGIYVTNRSAKNIFDLLPVEFDLKDKVTQSKKMNMYFKDAHKANVMLKDMVYGAESYADRLSNILRNMTESTMNNNEFRDTLRLMIKYKFITEEFAKFFLQQRNLNM